MWYMNRQKNQWSFNVSWGFKRYLSSRVSLPTFSRARPMTIGLRSKSSGDMNFETEKWPISNHCANLIQFVPSTFVNVNWTKLKREREREREVIKRFCQCLTFCKCTTAQKTWLLSDLQNAKNQWGQALKRKVLLTFMTMFFEFRSFLNIICTTYM